MKMISAAIACLLTASICFAGEDLSMWEEYGDTFVGTWQAEIRIDSDLPTGEQAGAIVQGEAEIEWILDKKAIVTIWRLGTLRGQTLEFWDPAEKCIRWNAVDSSGAFGGGTGLKIAPNRWIMKTQSMSPAGVRSSSTGDVTVSKSGDTHRLGSTQIVGRRIRNFRISQPSGTAYGSSRSRSAMHDQSPSGVRWNFTDPSVSSVAVASGKRNDFRFL